ncbi:MAG: glycosyltransferase [Chloroflexi bacterium]|nr:glycosyltransferase [Chloroflexota bacterium]
MNKPIFITARFRSGSTLLWNIFRNAAGAHAYYEPLHEQLPELIKLEIPPQTRHFFVESYFDQYPNVEQLRRFHKSEFGVHRLFLEANDQHQGMKDYFNYLISYPPQNKTVVLQENRIDFRLPWIRSNFPAAILVHLHRSPRDQWISTIQGFPGNIDQDIDSDPYRITTWSRDLIRQFPFLASPLIRHPYQRYYYLWKLSYLMGKHCADFSLAYEDLLFDPQKYIKQLLELGGLDTRENLVKCCKLIVKHPMNVWKEYQTESWFADLEQECENQLNGLGLNKGFGERPLIKIVEKNLKYKELVLDTRVADWGRQNAQVTVINLLNVADEKEKVLQAINTENKTLVGSVVAKEQMIVSQNREIIKLQKQMIKLQNWLQIKLAEGESVIQEREKTIQEREKTIQEREKTIQEREKVIQEKEKVIQSFRHSLFFWLVNGPLRYIPFIPAIFTRIRDVRRIFLPKIGVLEQHPPKPLVVPQEYKTLPTLSDAPGISIVTPSYNQARFIERTIRSVLDQNYPNLQFVIQDGKSTDNTLEILKSYRKELKHFESRRDGGQAHAINLGFAHTNGEIMAYLNSDDILLTGALHHVAQYFQQHPEVDAVYSHRVIIDEQDREIGRWVMPPHDPQVLYWADYVPQETLFWRRRIWEKSGGKLDESYKFALDWDLLMRFQQSGAVIHRVPRFLAAFRVHETQKTSAHINEIGLKEMERIRTHYIGREVTDAEINRNLRAYLQRSVLYHKLYRLGLYKA